MADLAGRSPEEAGEPAAHADLSPTSMAFAISRGERSAALWDFMQAGFAEWFRSNHRGHGGLGMSLAEAFGMSGATAGQWRLAQRDQALRAAARHLVDANSAAGPAALHAEWQRFVVRIWPRWRDEQDPPADASELHRALHYATDLNRGQVLCARQLQSICSRKFASLPFPRVPFRVETWLPAEPDQLPEGQPSEPFRHSEKADAERGREAPRTPSAPSIPAAEARPGEQRSGAPR